MQDTRGRRVQVIAATALAAMLLVGAAGCGGSSDGASSSDGSTKTTQSGSDKGGDKGGDKASADLPDPCDLVPVDKASEILGGESAKPESTSSDTGVGSRTCSWQTQEGKDNPSLDGAGHVLTLSVFAPPEGMSMSDFWDAAKTAEGAEETGVTDCSAGFWLGGLLSATVDGVYLTGSAGLADDSEAAKQSTMNLVSTACGSIS